MFAQYPYLNLSDFNLDYILKAIKDMRYEVTNFVSINAIKYANPIQWDITKQYEKNTIVIDPVTGTAYISVAPVPVGVALTRPEYWTVVFDLQSFVTKANQNLANNYEEQTTTTATMNTAAGNWVIWGDVLYKALVNITAGDAYVVGSNIQRIVIEDVINTIMQEIANEVQARQDADDAINVTIGDLDDLHTSDKSSIVNAINDEVQARQDADNDLQNNIDSVASDLAAEATTRQQQATNLQLSINGVNDTLTQAITNEATARTAADNALRQAISEVASQSNRKVVIIADSYGMVHDTTFLSILKTAAPTIYDGVGVSSIGFLPVSPYTFTDQFDIFIANYTEEQKNKVTDVILCGGWNDARQLGYYGDTVAELNNAILTTASHIKSVCPNATVRPCFMAWHSGRSQQNQVTRNSLIDTMNCYDGAIGEKISALTACKYPMRNVLCMDSSYFHPNETIGAPAIAKALHENLFNGNAHYNYTYNFSYAYLSTNPFKSTGYAVVVSITDDMTRVVSTPLFMNALTNISGGIIAVTDAPYMFLIFPEVTSGLGQGAQTAVSVLIKGTINGVQYSDYTPCMMYLYGTGNWLLLTPEGNLVTSIAEDSLMIINWTFDNLHSI